MENKEKIKSFLKLLALSLAIISVGGVCFTIVNIEEFNLFQLVKIANETPTTTNPIEQPTESFIETQEEYTSTAETIKFEETDIATTQETDTPKTEEMIEAVETIEIAETTKAIEIIEINNNSFSNTLKQPNEEIYYYYHPPVSGIYRFIFDSNDASTNYKFYLTTENNKNIATSNYTNEGKTVELDKNETYKITIKQDNGFPTYTINIGIPDEVREISQSTIEGDIRYIGEQDEYKYTAPISGRYRFDFDGTDKNCNYSFTIKEEDNTTIASSSLYNNGKTVRLEENKTYKIFVTYETGFLNYKIDIGVPKPIRQVEGNKIVDTIVYIDQEDRYTYIAPITGKYRFDFISDNVQNDYIFEISTLNNEILRSKHFNADGTSIDLIANETYNIILKHHVGFEEYTIDIGVPDEIQTVVGDQINGTLFYLDKQDRFTYVAPVSGEYLFSFDSDDVNTNYRFYIVSSNNETILSANYQQGSKKILLEGGAIYSIIIEQYNGYPSYNIYISY